MIKIPLPSILKKRVERILGHGVVDCYRIAGESPNLVECVDGNNNILRVDLALNKKIAVPSAETLESWSKEDTEKLVGKKTDEDQPEYIVGIDFGKVEKPPVFVPKHILVKKEKKTKTKKSK